MPVWKERLTLGEINFMLDCMDSYQGDKMEPDELRDKLEEGKRKLEEFMER